MRQVVEQNLDTIRGLLRDHTDRSEEGRILDILRNADAEALNQLLQGLDLNALFEAVDDRLLGPDHRAELFALLAGRLGDLAIPTRVAIVDGLQRGHTARQQEGLIRDVIRGTRGAELSALKNGIDAGGDYRDLQQLVFHDIDDDNIRSEILAHIAREGSGAERTEVKLLSDIDDTFYSSLKDERYPKNTTYPGVIPFYEAMDRSADGGRRGDIAFLTARPRVRAGTIEDKTQDMIRDRGLGSVTVLSGDFAHLRSHEAMAEKKYENFLEFRRLFPEYGFVFCGDSGQGDAIFGARIKAEFPRDVRAVFIHDVVDTSDSQRAQWLTKGVDFCDTYVGTATAARRAGLLSADALAGVVAAARQELAAIDFKEAKDAAKAAALARAFERDFAAAG